jgi:TPR repeat protein
MYRYGRAVQVDLQAAHALYQQACTGGFDPSCKTLETFFGK